MSKSFTTAVADAQAEIVGVDYPYDFDLDGLTVQFRKPGEGEGVMLAVAMGPHRPRIERVGAVIDVFARVLEPGVKNKVIDRLLNPDDPFGPDQMFGLNGEDGILAYMLECWSGHPTDG